MKGLDKIRDYIRPLQGALMLMVLLVGAVISGVLELFWPGKGIAFTSGVAGWFRAIPDSYYALLGALAGLYTIMRGAESIKGVNGDIRPDPNSFNNPDNPDRRV